MNYHRKSNANKKILVFSALGVLVFVTFFGIRGPRIIQDSLRKLATPLWNMGHSLASASHSLQAYITPPTNLARENILLQKQLQILTTISAENAFLKSELVRLQSVHSASKTNPSRVLARPPVSPYDILIVGTQGVPAIESSLVFSRSDTTAIGTLTRLLGSTGEVTLFSHTGITTEARLVHNASSLPITVTGKGGGILTARIPDTAPVSNGDVITTEGTVRPYLMGSVVSVEEHLHDAEKTLYIQLPVNVFTLTDVFLSSEKIYAVQPRPEEIE